MGGRLFYGWWVADRGRTGQEEGHTLFLPVSFACYLPWCMTSLYTMAALLLCASQPGVLRRASHPPPPSPLLHARGITAILYRHARPFTRWRAYLRRLPNN